MTPTYYVPKAKRRIFSPQCYFQTPIGHPDTGTESRQNGYNITLKTQGKEVVVDYNKRNNIPTLYAVIDKANFSTIEANISDIVSNNNSNLSAAQRELLKWHFRLGHVNYRTVQTIMKTGALGITALITAASKLVSMPICPSCQFGKAKKKSINPKGSDKGQTADSRTHESLSKDILHPGQQISMDHFSVTQRGQLFNSKGNTQKEFMYSGGCMFYDHASGYSGVEFQVNQNVDETIEAKHKFEKHLFTYGLMVHEYHSDNGVFKANAFIQELENNYQQIRFSGPYIHHQNGGVERSIGTVFNVARTMMLHAMVRWPEMIEVALWPMSIQYAVWLQNNMPKLTGMAPIDLLSRVKQNQRVLTNAHVFGCPAYVLDPKLQDGNSIPKFSPRSSRGMFVGFSRRHSSLVPLILNLSTLSISPQYHVVFDDWFTSVNSTGEIDVESPLWDDLFSSSRYVFNYDDDVKSDEEWMEALSPGQDRYVARDQLLRDVVTPRQRENNIENVLVSPPSIEDRPSPDLFVVNDNNDDDEIPPVLPLSSSLPSQLSTPALAKPAIIKQETHDRPHRIRKPPTRYGYDGDQIGGYLTIVERRQRLVKFHKRITSNKFIDPTVAYLAICCTDHDNGAIDYPNPVVFASLHKK